LEEVTNVAELMSALAVFQTRIAEIVAGVDGDEASSENERRIRENVSARDIVSASFLWNLIDDSQTANWQPINNTQGGGWVTINAASNAGWQVINTN
jgi:hypothetical protein